jgi:hypothetical protein
VLSLSRSLSLSCRSSILARGAGGKALSLVHKYKYCQFSTQVQILTAEEHLSPRGWREGTQFTCFTSTKVQILTAEELRAVGCWRCSASGFLLRS